MTMIRLDQLLYFCIVMPYTNDKHNGKACRFSWMEDNRLEAFFDDYNKKVRLDTIARVGIYT